MSRWLWALSCLVLAAVAQGCAPAAKSGSTGSGKVPIVVTADVDHRSLLSTEPSIVGARIRVRSDPAIPEQRAHINLAIVIDASGSMEGDGIRQARAAAAGMIETLADGDRIAVVSFGSKADVLVPSTELDGTVREELLEKIAALAAHGTTDMAAGLRAALDEVSKTFDTHGVNRVVLLGDGVPNDRDATLQQATRASSLGVSITSLGLGLEYDESLMGKLAEVSGGRFHFLAKPTEVAKIFESEVLQLTTVLARGASLRVVPGPGITIEDPIGRTFTRSGAAVIVSLGDLSRGEEEELFLRVTTPQHRAGVLVELFDAVVTFQDPTTSESGEAEAFVSARSTASVAEVAKGRDLGVAEAVAVARTGAAVIRALELARAGDRATARDILLTAADEADAFAKNERRDVLAKKAAELRALASDLPSPTAALPAPDADRSLAPEPASAESAELERELALRRTADELSITAAGGAGSKSLARAPSPMPEAPPPKMPAHTPPTSPDAALRIRQAHQSAMDAVH